MPRWTRSASLLVAATSAWTCACMAELELGEDELAASPAYFDDGAEPDAPEPPAVCGDAECTGDESCDDCPTDCGACDVACGDGYCDADEDDESCETCPEDCGACGPSCGDGACDPDETCETCASDCGMCADAGCPTCLLSTPAPAEDPLVCGRAHYAGGRSCRGVRGAYRASAVNVAYYPFRAVRDTPIYSGDPDSRNRRRHRLLVLRRGETFDVQSTRNPGCADSPPLRAAESGFVFGTKHRRPNRGVIGWVRADDLEFVGDRPGRTCASGPNGDDFQVLRNPYDACRALSCRSDRDGDDQRHCVPNNPRDQGRDDCDGARRLRLTREVSSAAGETALRYSPGGTPHRFLHSGDLVRAVLRVRRRGTSWDFVQVLRTESPRLTPAGSRGWVLSRYLVAPEREADLRGDLPASGPAAPSSRVNRPTVHNDQCARLATGRAVLRYADGRETGYSIDASTLRFSAPAFDDDDGRVCEDGMVMLDPQEPVETPSGQRMYFHRGGGGYADPGNVKYGHILASDVLPDPRVRIVATHGRNGAACEASTNSATRGRYRIVPRTMGRELQYPKSSFDECAAALSPEERATCIERPHDCLCTNGFTSYGDPGADQGDAATLGAMHSYTYLLWNWVNVRGGGVVRALLPPGHVFERCNVEAVRTESCAPEPASGGALRCRANGWVESVYGRARFGDRWLYGWITFAHRSYEVDATPVSHVERVR